MPRNRVLLNWRSALRLIGCTVDQSRSLLGLAVLNSVANTKSDAKKRKKLTYRSYLAEVNGELTKTSMCTELCHCRDSPAKSKAIVCFLLLSFLSFFFICSVLAGDVCAIDVLRLLLLLLMLVLLHVGISTLMNCI